MSSNRRKSFDSDDAPGYNNNNQQYGGNQNLPSWGYNSNATSSGGPQMPITGPGFPSVPGEGRYGGEQGLMSMPSVAPGFPSGPGGPPGGGQQGYQDRQGPPHNQISSPVPSGFPGGPGGGQQAYQNNDRSTPQDPPYNDSNPGANPSMSSGFPRGEGQSGQQYSLSNNRSFFHHNRPPQGPPPNYTHQNQAPPPSGFRISLTHTAPFPAADLALLAPCKDLDDSPVYIGSAILERSVHPCKIAPHLGNGGCCVPYGGQELLHTGRFDLLPFREREMEFVRAVGGRVPDGRRPVEGGYEEDGKKLYHGLAIIDGVRVPGKAAPHLDGCNVPFGGSERHSFEHDMLCWK